MEDSVQPKLNSYVWIKFGSQFSGVSFTKVKVVAKGSEIFFHEGSLDTCKCDEFREPIKYEDYKDKWFKSLKEIREDYSIKKIEDDYYEEVHL